ncbi:MAG TPA: PEFG-CTERM sorting domain-containing protein [Nitrosopumilaceae archaeon]|nr:PEFG-CTERM sorting domain-containing protein [Nitrosopumilaceae archaeon]
MKNAVIISFLIAVFFIPLSVNMTFAQQTHVINIPTGAASIDAPYFWQSEKDGDTSGKIQINALDSVRWENADTAAHTVTSGTPEGGPDGLFDSSLFGPGKDFEYQFKIGGDYEYFCIVHPWMTGIVMVSSDLQIIPNVGAKVGDGKTTFDVEYKYNKKIASATVDEKQKAITFEIVGKAKSEDHTLSLMLPKSLISEPYVIWVDGNQILDFKLTDKGGINEVVIPMKEKSERLTIIGASVVPEFGALTMIILGIALLSIMAISLKTNRINFPKL